jgi:hypothetical protein
MDRVSGCSFGRERGWTGAARRGVGLWSGAARGEREERRGEGRDRERQWEAKGPPPCAEGLGGLG